MHSWPHGPARIAVHSGATIVTGATYHKEPIFKGDSGLIVLQDSIFRHCHALNWSLQAWAVFPNHYHIVVHAPPQGNLAILMKRIHASSAKAINERDQRIRRMVWYRYWDTQITYERSYLARLNYVHNNPVKHGVAKCAEEYPYCSMGWFKTQGDRPFVESVLSFDTSQVKVYDDFLV